MQGLDHFSWDCELFLEVDMLTCSLSVAPSLTVENVMTVVKGVRNWRATAKRLLGNAYDKGDNMVISPGTDLDDLQRRHGSDEDCLREVVKIFLQGGGRYGHPTSWRVVIGSLYQSDELHLARQYRSYCEPLTGVLVYVCT